MVRAILYGPRDLRLDQHPLEPDLAPDQVRVETLISALSTGTDLGNYLGGSTYVPGAPDYPRWVGYSNAGVVRETGARVKGIQVGERYFANQPHQSEYVAPRQALLARIPGNVSSEEASLVYLANLGLDALQKARFQPGEEVGVIGLGVIGLCTVALARALGAARVGAVANSDARAQLAARLGATELAEADVVVLTANPWAAYRRAMELAKPRGRVAIVGFPGRGEPAPEFNPLAPEWIYAKQLTLLGTGRSARTDAPPSEIRFNLRRNLELILELLASGRVSFEPILSHRLPASRMREAYELAAAHDKRLTAAVFDWSEFHEPKS